MKKYMIILSLLGTSLALPAAEITAQPPEVPTIKSTGITRDQLPGPAELVMQYRSHISKIATQYLQECIASGLYQQLSPQTQILMQKFSALTWKKIDYKQDINVYIYQNQQNTSIGFVRFVNANGTLKTAGQILFDIVDLLKKSSFQITAPQKTIYKYLHLLAQALPIDKQLLANKVPSCYGQFYFDISGLKNIRFSCYRKMPALNDIPFDQVVPFEPFRVLFLTSFMKDKQTIIEISTHTQDPMANWLNLEKFDQDMPDTLEIFESEEDALAP